MNFRQLKYIQAIQREGSISGAAKKMFISQSALSQQLLKLETELGFPLFERGVSPIRPTWPGSKYLEYAEHVLFEQSQINEYLRDLESSGRYKLNIGIPANRSIQILPTFLPRFMNEYPNIELNIKEAFSWQLDEMVISGDLDFSFMVPVSHSPIIEFRPVFREEIFFTSPANDTNIRQALIDEHHIDLSCCSDKLFIIVKTGGRMRTLTQKLFKQYDIHPRILLETENTNLATHIVAGGMGVCFTSQLSALMTSFQTPPLFYSIGPDGIFWDLGICYRKDKYISWAMKLFFEKIQSEITQLAKHRAKTGLQ